MANIIDGRELAQKINAQTKNAADSLITKGIIPHLVVIYVGDDQASALYVRMKNKKAAKLGIKTTVQHFSNDVTQEELIELINQYNHDDTVHGIMVQSPLPKQVNESIVDQHIDPKKDVDGFNPVNVGKLFLGDQDNYPVSCTPKGILSMLKAYEIPLKGKNIVIIGRSQIVGRPMAGLLINERASTTVLNSASEKLNETTKKADVIISATGQLRLIDHQNIKPGVTIIDVGENHDENDKLVGDVDFEKVKDIASYITPVPGGVGPMTIATLMQQTVQMVNWNLTNSSVKENKTEESEE